MEDKFFTWRKYDAFCFYECTFKVDVGRFKAGQYVSAIDVDYDNCTMTVFDVDGSVTDFGIELVIYEIK